MPRPLGVKPCRVHLDIEICPEFFPQRSTIVVLKSYSAGTHRHLWLWKCKVVHSIRAHTRSFTWLHNLIELYFLLVYAPIWHVTAYWLCVHDGLLVRQSWAAAGRGEGAIPVYSLIAATPQSYKLLLRYSTLLSMRRKGSLIKGRLAATCSKNTAPSVQLWTCNLNTDL